MSIRVTNSQRPLIQSDDNQVSEIRSESLSEIASKLTESTPEKPGRNDAVIAKGEQFLAGLSRQIGLFKYALPNEPSNVTTMAVGEEDGGLPKEPGKATTMAVGEEDGGFNPNPKPSGGVTTMAVGEEDGG